MKNIRDFIKKNSVFGGEIFYLNRRVFVMITRGSFFLMVRFKQSVIHHLWTENTENDVDVSDCLSHLILNIVWDFTPSLFSICLAAGLMSIWPQMLAIVLLYDIQYVSTDWSCTTNDFDLIYNKLNKPDISNYQCQILLFSLISFEVAQFSLPILRRLTLRWLD